MEKVIEFMTKFIQDEFNVMLTRFDKNIDEEEQDKETLRLLNYYHSILSSKLSNYSRMRRDLTDEKLFLDKEPEKYVLRMLFQVRKYTDPVLGDALKRIVENNVLYACYVSYNMKQDSDIDFSDMFFVSETDEGMRIIDSYSYITNSGSPFWTYSHDHKSSQVQSLGQLVEIKRLIEPESIESLNEYNSDSKIIMGSIN